MLDGEAEPDAISHRRVSKWDRPKPDHDWRWVVAGSGRTLVSAGVLMFGFVAYQLWGTALQERASQNALEDEFEELSSAVSTLPRGTTPASAETAEPGTTAADGTILVPPSTAESPTDSTEPVPTVAADESGPSTTASAVSPPGASAPPNSLATAPPAVIAQPEVFEVVARLEIPKLGIDKYVVQGVSTSALKKGPGHFPETPLPGQLGNSAIACHRTTYGAPCLEIDQMVPGDEIVVDMGYGVYYYVVNQLPIITDPSTGYVEYVPTKDWNTATLTLFSCDPPYTARDRIVVIAELDYVRSAVVTQPSEGVTSDSGGTIPGEQTP